MLPLKTDKQILITSALPYVNNVPHLGTLMCILSADVYAKFLKSRGYKVLSVLGTDEHGTTTETKALEEGLTPRQLVDKYYKIHKEIYKWFNTDFDCFGRTSDKENFETSQDIFKKLYQNQFIIEKTTEQMWDEQAQKFLADRFVIGTCPHCQFNDAKGDQCDSCGKLLTPEELINPKSKITNTTPIKKETKHLYIDLKKIESELVAWIEKHENTWSANAATTTRAWIREGLKERALTRDLQWGIPVPIEGYEHKVLYSWFDAPIGYISITRACNDDWKQWWKNPEQTKLVQFMGKDNIPFHTILFPAFLIGARDNYTLLDTISVNEYINYESGKFSKSRGIGVFCDQAKQTGIPADIWRYYLIANRPEKEDTVFDWKDFQEKNNKELLANLGNLVNRTFVFIDKFCEGNIGQIQQSTLQEENKNAYKEVTELLENIELKKALKEIMQISKRANQYFQEQQPWQLIKEDTKKANEVLANLVHVIKDLSILLQPYMPEITAQIAQQMNIQQLSWNDLGKQLPKQAKITNPQALFAKLEDKEIQAFRTQFAGKQNAQQQEQSNKNPLDLRVAKIKTVEQHPDADKLFIIQLDVGTEKRTIVSGLAPYYQKEELLNKHIILVANLQAAKLRGVLSQGMLLAAENKKGEVGVVVAPHAQPGTRVHIENQVEDPKEITIKQVAAIALEAKENGVWNNDKALTVNNKPLSVDKGILGPIH